MNERKKIIQQIQDYFANTGVRRVSLFGSFARNEFDTISDVDLLMPASISPQIHLHIQPELLLIYEKSR